MGILGAPQAVRLNVALSLVLNLTLLIRHRAEVDRRGALSLLVPAVVATPFAAVLVRHLPARPAQAAAGAVVVVAALVLATGARSRALRGTAGALGAGVAAAFTTALAGVGGPALALWTTQAGWSVERSRATLQVVFLGLNLVTLVALGVPSTSPGVTAAAFAALALGLLLAAPAARRVTPAAARRTTLGLAFAGGVAVIVQAVG